MLEQLRSEAGTTLVELLVALALFSVVMAAAYFVLSGGNDMYLFAKDGFEAQDQSRMVLTKITKYGRQGQTLNVPGYPVAKADPKGTYFDVRIDVNNDDDPEIVRFELRQIDYKILMHIDYRASGKYNYQSIGDTKAAYDSTYPPGSSSGWDDTITVADKVVNTGPVGGWSNQNVATNPQTDKRLFTFYGNTMDTPLDSSSSIWMNFIRGMKIITLTDVRPAAIPTPFQVETNLNFRNLARE